MKDTDLLSHLREMDELSHLKDEELVAFYEKLPHVKNGAEILDKANAFILRRDFKETNFFSCEFLEIDDFKDLTLFELSEIFKKENTEAQTMMFPYDKDFYLHDFSSRYIENPNTSFLSFKAKDRVIYSIGSSISRFLIEELEEDFNEKIQEVWPHEFFYSLEGDFTLKAAGKEEEVEKIIREWYLFDKEFLAELKRLTAPYEKYTFVVKEESIGEPLHRDIIGSEASKNIRMNNFLKDCRDLRQPARVLENIRRDMQHHLNEFFKRKKKKVVNRGRDL